MLEAKIDKQFYIPKDKRKKILLITDDLLLPSGVGTIAREIVIHTAHHYNWIQIAGAINHPHKGKRFDLCAETNRLTGIDDSSIYLYPVDGYGDPVLLRQIINMEKPDAVFLITDPRYFTWLFQIENEIRKKIPIIYLNIWDAPPAPLYNKAFYESCDLLLGISKQTTNINKVVLGDKTKNKIISYVPHGLNDNKFFPIQNKEENKEFLEFKKQILGDKKFDFTIFFNSRNIRRKQIPDTFLAFKLFLEKLPKEEAEKCCLLLHTSPVDDNGTDLYALREFLFGRDCKNVIFSDRPLGVPQMNYLYNMSNVQILLTSNEGWGLSLTESLLAGNPIIAHVQGGMQDQMRFEDEKGNWIDFNDKFMSNHNGTYKKHGEWAFPVYSASKSLVGSVPTPYIWEERCKFEDAAEQIMAVYKLHKQGKLADLGLKGREWATGEEAGFTSFFQAKRIMKNVDLLFEKWVPREKFELIKVNKYNGERKLNHELTY